jgi:Ca2+-binding EF-hand superfamily protein
LEKEIRYHHRLERNKSELSRRYDFSTLAAFDSVDTLRRGQIANADVQAFLKVNGYYATESEIIAIIRRLDVDAD